MEGDCMSEKIIELIKEKNNYNCIICGSANSVYMIKVNRKNKRECIMCSNICEKCRVEIIKEMNDVEF